MYGVLVFGDVVSVGLGVVFVYLGVVSVGW